MSWVDKRVTGWMDFVREAQKIITRVALNEHLMCRGQADRSWTLRPSLLRSYRARASQRDLIVMEEAGLETFKYEAWAYAGDERLPKDGDIIEWWVLMQHYGAPTRMLDWTPSPYVACYFAVIDEPKRDGAVWFCENIALNEAMGNTDKYYFRDKEDHLDEFFLKVRNPARLHTYRPERPTARVIAQSGQMTVCEKVNEDHDLLIDGALTGSGKSRLQHGRLIIPKHLKREFQLYLDTMNINATSLFPGIDGIGRRIKELTVLHKRK